MFRNCGLEGKSDIELVWKWNKRNNRAFCNGVKFFHSTGGNYLLSSFDFNSNRFYTIMLHLCTASQFMQPKGTLFEQGWGKLEYDMTHAYRSPTSAFGVLRYLLGVIGCTWEVKEDSSTLTRIAIRQMHDAELKEFKRWEKKNDCYS